MTPRFCAAFSLGIALALSGCSRLPDSTFQLRAETDTIDLPAIHKAQVAAYVAMFHGTPANPRMAMPDEEAVEKAYATYEAAADQDDPAASKDRPTDGVYKLAGSDAPGFDRLQLKRGREVYTAQCAGCHGTTGDGKGTAGPWLNPPPRDYRNGVFKFTSTPRGSKPRREDLRRILTYGAKGTSMPSFRFLPKEDLEAVIDYVQVLASRGELEIALLREAENELDEEDDFDPEVVAEYVTDIAKSWKRAESELVRPITVNPPSTPETIHSGAQAFAALSCVKCHGTNARGSKSADVGEDIWGRTAYPADLTMGMLHGGRRPVDIYRRIYSGINGTPMPSSKDPNTAIGETPEQRSDRIWHLVHFVTSVIENNDVATADHEAILDVLQKQASEQQGSEQPAPAKEAADVTEGQAAKLVATEASP
jgi:mono/diheme cytochrome c family protein